MTAFFLGDRVSLPLPPRRSRGFARARICLALEAGRAAAWPADAEPLPARMLRKFSVRPPGGIGGASQDDRTNPAARNTPRQAARGASLRYGDRFRRFGQAVLLASAAPSSSTRR